MEKAIKIQVPNVPNFILTQRKYLDDGQHSIPIEDFTEEELRQIGKEWTELLVIVAQERRENKK